MQPQFIEDNLIDSGVLIDFIHDQCGQLFPLSGGLLEKLAEYLKADAFHDPQNPVMLIDARAKEILNKYIPEAIIEYSLDYDCWLWAVDDVAYVWNEPDQVSQMALSAEIARCNEQLDGIEICLTKKAPIQAGIRLGEDFSEKAYDPLECDEFFESLRQARDMARDFRYNGFYIN